MMQMQVERITFAVNNMKEMVAFYNAIFNTELTRMGDSPFYAGSLVGTPILFCPNDIAEVDARQNRHQFRYRVENLDVLLHIVISSGGTLKDKPEIDGLQRIASVIDPDGNTIEFVEQV